MFSVVTVLSRGPEAEIETTVAGVRFDLGPGVGREGLSLRDPAAGLVDYSHWLTALRYLTDAFEGKKKTAGNCLSGIYFRSLLGARGRALTRLCYQSSPVSNRIRKFLRKNCTSENSPFVLGLLSTPRQLPRTRECRYDCCYECRNYH